MKIKFLRANCNRLTWIALFLILLIWGGALTLVALEKKQEEINHQESVNRLAQFFEDQSMQIFNYADSYIQFVRREYLIQNSIDQINELLLEVPLDTSIVSHITIIDANGTPLLVSGHDIKPGSTAKDRAYFKHQKDVKEDRLHISEPYLGRNSGKKTIRIVRPILAKNGEFLGVIFAAIEDKRFVAFFDALNEGHNSTAMLIGLDRKLRAHSKMEMLEPDRMLEHHKIWDLLKIKSIGNYVQNGEGHHDIYYTYRKLDNYPLVVMIGQPIEDDHGEFSDANIFIYGFAVFCTLVVSVLFFFVRRERKNSLALKLNQHRIRDFAESASDWFWEMDADLRFTYFSERNREVTGQDPAIFIGKTRRELTVEDVTSEKWEQHFDDLENHRIIRNFNYDLIKGDGTKVNISISGKPVFDQNGTFQGYRGTGSDYTKQMLAQEERDSALFEAERANHAKSNFLANMSHELRTPLNAIIGFSSGLLSGGLGKVENEKHVGYLKDINHSGEFLLDLINDILDISKIEAGEVEAAATNINTREVGKTCIEMLKTRADEAGHKIAMNIPDDLPDVWVDRRHLNQILLNLLSNAVKFTPREGEVTLSGSVNSDGCVSIIVADTGIGVSKGDIPKILTPFGQVAHVMTRNHEGTGLGLSIAKSLAELNDADFNFESGLGEGTSVTITFQKNLQN